MKLSMGSVVACVCVLSLMAGANQAQEEVIVVPTGERQLFLDDYVVAELNNLIRTMHRPAKKGAVIRPTPPETGIQTRCAPAWDPQEKVYKIWYLYSDGTQFGGIGYVESKDGLHWTKVATDNVPLNPDIPTVKAPMNAVYDPSDPDPSRRYKGFGHAHGREPFVSANGIDWQPLDVPPVTSGDESNLSFDEQEHRFIATVKHGGPYGRSVYLITSTDFEHWAKEELIFHADEFDQELGRRSIEARFADPTLWHPEYNSPASYGVDVYNMGVFRYEGLYIGMPAMFHSTGPVPNYPNTVGFHLVQLTCSRDLHNWKRVGNRQSFIGPSRLRAGAYDLTQILPPSSAVVRGDELWFYYTGLKYRGGSTYVGEFPDGEWVQDPDLDTDTGAICLAVLRRDGFVSLDAGEEAGTVLTKPFSLPGQHLFVNIDAPQGELRAELVDASGQPLDGFAIDKCVPVTGDHVRAEVTWEGHSDISALAGQDVQIRFRLQTGSFYAFWFE